MGIDKFDLVAGKERLEAICLRVHVFYWYLVGGRVAGDSQVGSVYIDWIVVRPEETGVFDRDLTFAAWHLYEIGKTGTGTSASGLRFECQIPVSDIFCHLPDNSEVTQECQMYSFQCDVFTVLDKSASLVTDTVTHLEYRTLFGLWRGVIYETEQVGVQLYCLAKAGKRRPATPGYIFFFVIALSDILG